MDDYKIHLPEADMPQAWYNIQPDLPRPLPPYLHPATGQPVTPQDLAPIFPMELILQEVSQERQIPIPDEVQRIYRLWRPTPLRRARRLEARRRLVARGYPLRGENAGPAAQAAGGAC